MLESADLPTMRGSSHIVPVVVGDPQKCRAASDLLLTRHGIRAQGHATAPHYADALTSMTH